MKLLFRNIVRGVGGVVFYPATRDYTLPTGTERIQDAKTLSEDSKRIDDDMKKVIRRYGNQAYTT